MEEKDFGSSIFYILNQISRVTKTLDIKNFVADNITDTVLVFVLTEKRTFRVYVVYHGYYSELNHPLLLVVVEFLSLKCNAAIISKLFSRGHTVDNTLLISNKYAALQMQKHKIWMVVFISDIVTKNNFYVSNMVYSELIPWEHNEESFSNVLPILKYEKESNIITENNPQPTGIVYRLKKFFGILK